MIHTKFSSLESILSLDKESKIIWIYIGKNNEKEKRLYIFEMESLAEDWYNAEVIKESFNSNRDELHKTMTIAPN